MLWIVFAIAVLLWSLGYSHHVAGNFIHLLLAVALGISFFKFFAGRRQAE